VIKIFRYLVPIMTLSLTACGGGGGGAGWTAGIFLDANTFLAKCEVPRTGINPATGNAYRDVQGTTTDENNFLRSYSDDTYLWYNEIVDQDPSLFSDTLVYFDELVTTALTSTNQPKDKFHFTYDSEEWFQLSQSGVSAGYGIQWAFLSSTVPRDIRIAYTEPNSPATNLVPELARGALVLGIDGFDIDVDTQAGIDALNAALFPTNGAQHTFTVLDLGAANSRDVTMTATNITSEPVQNTQVFSTPTGDVGYMLFNDHIATAEQSLIDAVNLLNSFNNNQGIDDLVLDMRYNGGGYLAIASEFAYMIAGATATAGRTFEEMQFNDKHPVTNPVTGQALSPTPFYNVTLGPPFNAVPGQALPTLGLPRVYVITGGGTCSASEAVMNGLRGVVVSAWKLFRSGRQPVASRTGFMPRTIVALRTSRFSSGALMLSTSVITPTAFHQIMRRVLWQALRFSRVAPLRMISPNNSVIKPKAVWRWRSPIVMARRAPLLLERHRMVSARQMEHRKLPTW